MASVFFNKSDYRSALRDPFGSMRAHAVCRQLTGTASQASPLYAAHYWSACGLLDSAPDPDRYRDSFLRELTGGYRNLPTWAHAAWRMACERVQSIRDAALALKNSNLW